MIHRDKDWWSAFRWSDWIADTRCLSPVAKGCWIDTLAYMAMATRKGQLTYPLSTFARTWGVTEDVAQNVVSEILTLGVADGNADDNASITLISRCMIREAKQRFLTAKRQRQWYQKHAGDDVRREPNSDLTSPPASIRRAEQKQNRTEAEQNREENTPIVPKTPAPAALDSFSEFWKEYPKRTGKKAARRSWHKAKDKPPLPEILAAIRKQAASDQWKKDGGQYIPNPATWLNQGRWADEPQAGTSAEASKTKWGF